MIEGKKIKQVSKVFTRTLEGDYVGIMIERDHRVVRFKHYLPAGPLPGGAVRQKDLIAFWADPGGLRTINAEDIVLPD